MINWWHHIPIEEWKKRLAWQPAEVIDRTLCSTTQHYLIMECESRNDPRGHIKIRTPGLRQNRLNESVATDTLFPSIKSDRGNNVIHFLQDVHLKDGRYIPWNQKDIIMKHFKISIDKLEYQTPYNQIMLEVNKGRNDYSTVEIIASKRNTQSLIIHIKTQQKDKQNIWIEWSELL